MAEPTIEEMALAVARELEDGARWTSRMGGLERDRSGKIVRACAAWRAIDMFGDDGLRRLGEAYKRRHGDFLDYDNDRRGRLYVRDRLLQLAEMDPVGELRAMLGRARVTFSRWCRTGLLQSMRCECWRCRKARGEEPDEELAESVAMGADLGWKHRSREWLVRLRGAEGEGG